MKQDYLVYPSMIGAQSGIIVAGVDAGVPAVFDDSNPLNVSVNQCNNLTVCLWYVSPVWELNDVDKTSYALLGELSKWTAVSPQRFTSIVQDTEKNQITITVQGLLNEHITLVFLLLVQTVEVVTCWTSATNGQARFIITANNIACA
jgi:hypothetical protein